MRKNIKSFQVHFRYISGPDLAATLLPGQESSLQALQGHPSPDLIYHAWDKNPRGSSQTERAYQKQPTIFQNKKRVLLGEGGKEKLPRYYKNIGLGFKTPKEAIEGTYIDKKCPFTGNVSIRGRILSGVVTKMKMQRTIVIRRDYLHYIRKYNRFEKRHKNMSVHLSPCFRDVQIGDIVTVGECRPLSKTVRFNVLKVTKAAGTKKQFQKF
ncbi:PREDICTED: 40S ribosomal protein S11 [Pygoscelis adeliae]|uniref:40S ribosomal protein S11 n=1 Tax=Pygoscelis adeliae TaxID=9238 RepID=UPI0004F4EE20|nr:PREDICTED: 40S ribosomal protein S11 [Pygoscelis adeliae]